MTSSTRAGSAAALDQRAQGVGEQVDRVDAGERTARPSFANGGTDGFHDDCVTHGNRLL
jgi:hypothetical protein